MRWCAGVQAELNLFAFFPFFFATVKLGNCHLTCWIWMRGSMSIPSEALWQVYICLLWCQLFGLIKTFFLLCCMLAVTCFCSFHKRTRLPVCSLGRCTAITALLWRSAGHAALCTRTKGTFPLSYFPSDQHRDESTTIKGIVLQHADVLHTVYTLLDFLVCVYTSIWMYSKHSNYV